MPPNLHNRRKLSSVLSAHPTPLNKDQERSLFLQCEGKWTPWPSQDGVFRVINARRGSRWLLYLNKGSETRLLGDCSLLLFFCVCNKTKPRWGWFLCDNREPQGGRRLGASKKGGKCDFFFKVLVFYSSLIGGWQGPSVAFKIKTDLAFLVFKTEFGRKNGSQAGIWGLLSNSFLDLRCQSLSN